MQQIQSKIKDDIEVILLLPCFVGHPVISQRYFPKSNFPSDNIWSGNLNFPKVRPWEAPHAETGADRLRLG